MRVTHIFFRQHIGRMFRAHWIIQGKRVPIDTGAEKILTERGIPILDPVEFIKYKRPLEHVEVVGNFPKEIKYDATHPDWHDRICYTYRDNNFLLEGLDQAKVLTKTVELKEGLPAQYDDLPKASKEIDAKVLKAITSAHLFDTEQVKLPKIKDPKRPAWNFPRVHGISDRRVNYVLISKLLQLVERLSDPTIVSERCITENNRFLCTLEKENDLFQLQLCSDKFVTALKPLRAATDDFTDNFQVPEIFPMKCCISIPEEHIYKVNDLYPIDLNFPKAHPHTIFVHYNRTEVKNLYEELPTESQILSLSLMKTFVVAATYAKKKFGDDVKVLPKPVTVQCVQTDGQQFHFGVFQLNTLDLNDGGGDKNVWFHRPRVSLFSQCQYELGKPVFHGYNSEVIRHLLAFYNNN